MSAPRTVTPVAALERARSDAAERQTSTDSGPRAEFLEERVAREIRRELVQVYRAIVAFLPTQRLALVVALLSPVWLLSGTERGPEIIAIVLLLLVLAVIVDVITIPARWQVEVARTLPPQVGLGDPVEGSYRIVSRVKRALRVQLFDRLPRAITVERLPSRQQVVPPEGEISLPFGITGRERGEWPLGPIVVRVEGALGLMRRSLRNEPGDSVLVAPSMTGVRHLRLLAIQHRLRDAGVRNIRQRGEGTTFASLREYVTGDDPRHVDWKATARRHKLITREFTVEQGQTVMIAIDAGRMMTQLSDGIPRFEYALSSAMLLADVAAQSRDNVGLLLFDDEIRAFVPAARGKQALERIRRALIPAAASMAEPDYATAFRLLSERHRKRSLIVLFTDVIDPRASRALIAHTARSAARHMLLVVALRNDHLMNAAVPDARESAGELFESAAAEELVAAREEALLRMRRAGVQVLDVSPAEMTPAVINRYLEIKARGSL
ncbi:MAG TPA: DUF58 domain-containing protein [Gemmatimonadaceae bacterium]|nr:DUF58 domain-containing protein [Gemmatimonadaceae bacterium]